ncbi:MAG: AAA family ATPase [Patescibacteria group bacterium]
MINQIYIKNFKLFQAFTLSLNKDLNIIVGNNEAGKSTILEAIALVLTKRLNGKAIEYELSSHLFNKASIDAYLKEVAGGGNPVPPEIVIELYLEELAELQYLRGNNNSQKTDYVGLKLVISFDDEYADEYSKLLEAREQIKTIPTEYYKVHWYSFANNAITPRSLPVAISNIDATTIRLQSGTDYFLQEIINGSLDAKEKVSLAIAYRKLKEQFSAEDAIVGINAKLTQNQGAITTKKLAISIDTSQKTNWENSLIPHLDELPFQFIGKGEQSALKIMLALERQAKESNVILIEEPENHLSFSSMSTLIKKIREKCAGKQIVIVTHSAYVLNKLGIDKVIFLHEAKHSNLSKLPPDTQDYFKKLSGYDTLRLILAKKAILVEGPSDELIVQKAFLVKHGKLPIEAGVDVISVRGLSFARFLDIAKELSNTVAVVTDNDGDYENKVEKKYTPYSAFGSIKVCADKNNALTTLEPHIAEVNGLDVLNKVFGKAFKDKPELVDYMTANKTECALALFETNEKIEFPAYVKDAVS